MDVPLLRSLFVSTFANYPEYFNVTTTQQQNSVMKFCFILGTDVYKRQGEPLPMCRVN